MRRAGMSGDAALLPVGWTWFWTTWTFAAPVVLSQVGAIGGTAD